MLTNGWNRVQFTLTLGLQFKWMQVFVIEMLGPWVGINVFYVEKDPYGSFYVN